MYETTYLQHHGIKGQKWGARRYQNADGSVTSKGAQRYYSEYGDNYHRSDDPKNKPNATGDKKKDKKQLTDKQKKILKTTLAVAGVAAAAGTAYVAGKAINKKLTSEMREHYAAKGLDHLNKSLSASKSANSPGKDKYQISFHNKDASHHAKLNEHYMRKANQNSYSLGDKARYLKSKVDKKAFSGVTKGRVNAISKRNEVSSKIERKAINSITSGASNISKKSINNQKERTLKSIDRKREKLIKEKQRKNKENGTTSKIGQYKGAFNELKNFNNSTKKDASNKIAQVNKRYDTWERNFNKQWK